MAKIKHLATHSQQNEEHFQFHKEHIKALELEPEVSASLGGLSVSYKQDFVKLDDAYKLVRKSDFTHLIDEEDGVRDRMRTGLWYYIQAAKIHKSEEIANAGRRLDIVVSNTYGNVNHLSNVQQSAAVTNLVQDLRSDKYKNDIALVRGKEWVDYLEESNNIVIELTQARENEKLAKPDVRMAEARKIIDTTYRAITDRVNALVVIEGDAKYAGYIKRINNLIDKYTSAMNMRAGKRKKKVVINAEVSV